MENVAQIKPYERLFSWNPPSPMPRKKNPKRKLDSRYGAKFTILTQLAHDTHQILVEKGSPLRLCVYKDEEDLLMDVITMDKTRKINQSFTRPIGKDSLKRLTKKMHNQMGLVLDYTV